MQDDVEMLGKSFFYHNSRKKNVLTLANYDIYVVLDYQYPVVVDTVDTSFLSGKVTYRCSIKNVMYVHLMRRPFAILCKDQMYWSTLSFDI